MSSRTHKYWTKAQENKLRQLWDSDVPGPDVAKQLGRSHSSVKNRARVLGLKKHGRFVFDEWSYAWLIALYPHIKTELVAFAIGAPKERSVFVAAKRLGLRKTQEYLDSPDACRLRREDSPGKAFRFQKGNVPMNKGIKGWQAGGRSLETQFKKGQRPHTFLPVGSISYSQDGFPRRKVADPNVWEFCHRAEWEKHHGPIPKGHVVSFKDNDRTNWAIENLELLTFAQNLEKMRTRMLAAYGPELIATKKALTRLRNHIDGKRHSTRPSRRNRRSQKRALCNAAGS